MMSGELVTLAGLPIEGIPGNWSVRKCLASPMWVQKITKEEWMELEEKEQVPRTQAGLDYYKMIPKPVNIVWKDHILKPEEPIGTWGDEVTAMLF